MKHLTSENYGTVHEACSNIPSSSMMETFVVLYVNMSLLSVEEKMMLNSS